MAFASINPTNPRTNMWNFCEKILRIGDFEKLPFWKIGYFEFFFGSFSWKSVQICMVEWMGQNLTFSLVFMKFLAMCNITLYSVTCNIKKKKTLSKTLNWGNWNSWFVKLGVRWAEQDKNFDHFRKGVL